MSIDDDLIGTIVFSAGIHTPPNWLACDGKPYLRSDFPKLFAAIGTLYGAGEPDDKTFRVPDMRGRVAVAVGGADAELNHTLASPVGKATASVNGTTGGASGTQHMHGSARGDLEAGDPFDFTPGGHNHSFATASSTIQPGLILNCLIKAK
ncbi:tail fiber protein [Bradyrhizobium sp. U87765 SZCCT0131]|uniref:phage tail protein n=1 Tax=unclassified Bradyrhizobium TaxID=2631580 RepID=UPI001BAC3FBD|nr:MULTISPECIES: phage tail protein [unclassified Bradyrhizobium]MBR1218072.1 tail fiber protein [Bradyrhizobium sp. U87765 SZCCT0131]MBR1260982.1 tail fiber protein [Bradyrhizobium sp. U87765 SZCCT0134]MBR1303570.1 tail fiber protein [Bradyrhizobium sp. U87765 SZCCT0110]MBR1319176.1 tail fiber protein [Bradyrhizobium sp. U87765 SZCCT0109]MBR1347501.1 tail fiber protein [Bradyrhizobium sp. U87765 SZCCT0048]